MSAHVNLNQFFEVDAYLVAQLKTLTRGELPRGNLIECAAAAGSKSKRGNFKMRSMSRRATFLKVSLQHLEATNRSIHI